MVHLKPGDVEILRELRNFGVLQDVQPELIDMTKGICLMPCADGDRFDPLYMFFRGMLTDRGFVPRIHPLTGHGGSIVVSCNSPLNKDNRGNNLLADMDVVIKKKGITTFVLESHAPCEGADAAHLSILDQVRLHKEGAAAIRSIYPGIQLVCVFHAYWEDREDLTNRDKIYYLSDTKWKEYRTLHM